jgi:hypothetical protein
MSLWGTFTYSHKVRGDPNKNNGWNVDQAHFELQCEDYGGMQPEAEHHRGDSEHNDRGVEPCFPFFLQMKVSNLYF